MDVLRRVGLVVILHFISLTCTEGAPLCTRQTFVYNITQLGNISCATAVSLPNNSNNSVEWRLEGQVLTTTTTNDLDLSTVNNPSPGFNMFQCDFNYSITDNGTTTTNVITCNVNVTINSLPVVTISPQTISMAILYPNNTPIECTASGFPPPSVTWELDSYQISSNGTLNFRSNETKIGNDQDFVCVGANSIGIENTSITITVQAMPPTVSLSPSSPIEEFIGNSTTFQCSATSDLTTAQPSITWQLNGNGIPPTGESYTIENVSTSDSGIYSCSASILNSEIVTSNSVELMVISPPPRVTITRNETGILTVNQGIELTCDVTPLPFDDNLPVSIDWTFPSTTTRSLTNSKSQTLTNLQLTDRGNYVCSARVGNSDATVFSISLDIVPLAPSLTAIADNLNPLIGSMLTITCSIMSPISSNFPRNITWYFNSTVITDESNETLVISSVMLSDTGMYICSATIEGSDSGNSTPVSIEVYQKPQNQILSNSPRTTIEGYMNMIWCNATGVPEPSIIWSDQFNRNYMNPLQLFELNNTATGNFTCIATSAAGDASESIFITIVPVAPMLDVTTSESHPVLNRIFTLICDVTSVLPIGRDISDFLFNWTRQDSTDILSTSQNYSFTADESTNGSVYQCSATVAGSGEGMAEGDALMLQSEPRITNFSLSDLIYIGLTYTAVCEAEGVPTPTVTFIDIQDPMRILDPPYLLSEDSPGQRGYNCSAVNIHGTASDTKSVTVTIPEIVIQLQSNISTIVEGGAFRITCSVASNDLNIPLIDTSYVISDNVTGDHVTVMSPDNKTATVDIVADDIETPETVYLFSCRVYIQGGKILSESSMIVIRITDTPIPAFPLTYIYAISAIVVILFIILLVLVIITAVCCCVKGKRRRRDIVPKNTKNYVELDTPIAAATGFSFPILVSKFSETYEMLLEDNQQRLKEQYSQLATIKAVAEEAKKNVNTTKNRYPDVLAYDHSRVVISKVQGTDYINANFMDGFRPESRYIAAQGPLGPPKLQTTPTANSSAAPELNTVNDFWRMIWEHSITTVVMLTNLIENNRIKCALYWPADTRNYGRIRVSLTEESQFCDYVIRKFLVERIQVRSGANAARQITQFHFTSWPDHGVPLFPISMIQFVKRVRSHISQTGDEDNAPNLIHCSAGVGRTGTFICLDILLQQLAETAHTIDIWSETSRLRHNRNHMIQEYLQYEFVHQAINEHIHFGDTECSAADFPKMISFLNEVTDENPYKIGMSRLEVEFKKLHMKVMSNQHRNAMRSENSGKNRFINTMPFDNNCVKLRPIPGVTGSDYINASYIDSDKTHRAFIATQGPLKSTMEDFWRMIIEIGSNVIVMLTENTEDKTEDYFSFSHIHHGPFHVQTLKKHMHNDYVHRELLIRIDDKQESYTVHHFQLTKLLAPIHSMKDCAKGLLSLITGITMTLHSDEEHEKKVPKVVHCGTGNGMTGVFIAVCIILQRLEYEDRIDVFNTVKRLRMQRVAMVQTVDQYDLCYRTVMEYLQSSP